MNKMDTSRPYRDYLLKPSSRRTPRMYPISRRDPAAELFCWNNRHYGVSSSFTGHQWVVDRRRPYTSQVCFLTWHDYVITWKRLPHYWPFGWGIHRWISPHKGRWCRAFLNFIVSLNNFLKKKTKKPPKKPQKIEVSLVWDVLTL